MFCRKLRQHIFHPVQHRKRTSFSKIWVFPDIASKINDDICRSFSYVYLRSKFLKVFRNRKSWTNSCHYLFFFNRILGPYGRCSNKMSANQKASQLMLIQSEGVTADATPIWKSHSWCSLVMFSICEVYLKTTAYCRCTRPLSLFVALHMEQAQFVSASHGKGSICERCLLNRLSLWYTISFPVLCGLHRYFSTLWWSWWIFVFW